MARKMKDSGVEWIGEIPEDWDYVPLKRVLKGNDGAFGEMILFVLNQALLFSDLQNKQLMVNGIF